MSSGQHLQENGDQKKPIVFISRRETFSACHRLHSPHLTDGENVEIFGKCNNFHGHGHNYTVEVTVKGEVSPVTGMVMNLTDLKKCIQEAVMDTMDHKSLDKDVPYFKNIVSSAENICVFIWQSMKRILPRPELLYEIKVYESEKNIAFYRGDLG